MRIHESRALLGYANDGLVLLDRSGAVVEVGPSCAECAATPPDGIAVAAGPDADPTALIDEADLAMAATLAAGGNRKWS